VIFPQPMVRLTAVILQRDMDEVTRKLLNLGVMDFIDARGNEFSLASKLTEIKQKISGSDIGDLRSRIENLMESAHLPLPSPETLDAEQLAAVDSQLVQKDLDNLASEIRVIRDQQKDLQQDLNRKSEILRQTELFEQISGQAPRDSAVEVISGLVKKTRREAFSLALAAFPAVTQWGQPDESDLAVMLLYLKRDQTAIDQILDRFAWQAIEFPPELRGHRDEIVERLTREIRDIESRQKQLQQKAVETVKAREQWLRDSWKNLQMTGQYIRMQDSFGKTTETILFTGWIPRNLQSVTEKCIRETTLGRCYLEWAKPDGDPSVSPEKVPVKLSHIPLLKPFQWLVQNYSTPRYGSIDPTVLVAFTYLTMFGLMFGDAGHGFVLMVLGALTALLNRKAGGTIYDLGRLIFWCGGAAIVTGILFGSYFGYSWFPALWFNYHGIVSGHEGHGLVSDVYDILGITIRLGIFVIGAGIFLNIVNRIRSKSWFHLFFDKGGLFGGWFYAGGVYTSYYFVQSGYKTLPSDEIMLFAVLIPASVFVLKSPLEFFEEHKKHGKPFKATLIMDWIMHWIVELLELFSGYLSNTLSFMRIAGLGIAHVSLMTAFFQIAGGFDSSLASALILIFGNTLVIALEGLSAGIQSLRLNYYEFFSKYFCGSGKVYEPISLRRSN